jgi:hypothetical protein
MMNSYNRLLFLTVLLATCLGCKKKRAEVEITLEYPLIYPYTLSPDSKLSDTLLVTQTLDIQDSIAHFMSRNHSSVEKISSVKLMQLNLYQYDMDTMQHGNFRDFSDISLYMYHPIPRQKRIAHKLVPDIATPVLITNPENTELREYLVNQGSALLFAYTKRRPTNKEMPFIAYLRLKIVAQPL